MSVFAKEKMERSFFTVKDLTKKIHEDFIAAYENFSRVEVRFYFPEDADGNLQFIDKWGNLTLTDGPIMSMVLITNEEKDRGSIWIIGPKDRVISSR